jgi:hypothetical protein
MTLDEYVKRVSGLKKFNNENIDEWFMTLDDCVINALELLEGAEIPKIPPIDSPIVMGSGNAYYTGVLLFEDQVAFTATESTYMDALDSLGDFTKSGVVISASGSKNAGGISEELKRRNIENRYLLTCTNGSEASSFFDIKNIFVLPKCPEPYTYNTSTYLGMLLTKYQTSPRDILDHIRENVDPILDSWKEEIDNANAFYLMVPNEAENIKSMFHIKFEELFGRRFGRDIYTPEFADKHATDIIPTDGELKVAIGCHGPELSKEDIHVPLPSDNPRDYSSLMAVGYYTIGKMQLARQNLFKDNIVDWCEARGKSPLVV